MVKPKPVVERSLSEAARDGQLEGLRALRDHLTGVLEVGDEQTASLARQLREVLASIAELEKLTPKGSIVDEIARKRKARRASAAGDGAAGGRGGERGSGGG